VGTSYYKEVKAPTVAGHFNEILVHWNMETIKQDHGKDHLSKIPKYDGFTCIPSHINFKQEYLRFYNIYSPLGKQPKEGNIPTINNQNKLQGFRFELDDHNLKGSEIHRNMSLGNIGKQMTGIQGKSILKENNVSIKLADKLVDLTPKLALKITKFILKKAIDRGISY
tara:strand:- start:114 stop:617 length:504 start_codon:yes stop_codon:yes gene_type:complete